MEISQGSPTGGSPERRGPPLNPDEEDPILRRDPRRPPIAPQPQQQQQSAGTIETFASFLQLCVVVDLLSIATIEILCFYYDIVGYKGAEDELVDAKGGKLKEQHESVTVFLLKFYVMALVLTGLGGELGTGPAAQSLKPPFKRGQFYIFLALLIPVMTTQQVYGVFVSYLLETLSSVLLIAGVVYSLAGVLGLCFG